MREFPGPVSAQVSAREKYSAQTLLWFTGETNGTPFSLGLWDGLHDQGFFIQGQARTYLSGAVMTAPPLVAEAGLKVRNFRAALNVQRPEVKDLILGQNIEGASVEMHTAHCDPATRQKLGEVLDVRGQVRNVDMVEGGAGNVTAAEIVFTSTAVLLDYAAGLRKSSESLQARQPGDTFRQYNQISAAVKVAWGDVLATAPGSPPPEPVPVDPINVTGPVGWGP